MVLMDLYTLMYYLYYWLCKSECGFCPVGIPLVRRVKRVLKGIKRGRRVL